MFQRSPRSLRSVSLGALVTVNNASMRGVGTKMGTVRSRDSGDQGHANIRTSGQRGTYKTYKTRTRRAANLAFRYKGAAAGHNAGGAKMRHPSRQVRSRSPVAPTTTNMATGAEGRYRAQRAANLAFRYKGAAAGHNAGGAKMRHPSRQVRSRCAGGAHHDQYGHRRRRPLQSPAWLDGPRPDVRASSQPSAPRCAGTPDW